MLGSNHSFLNEVYKDNIEYTEDEREKREKELQKGIEEFKNINQQELFSRKQKIEVKGVEVEFTKFDNIFTLSKTQVENNSKDQLSYIFGKNIGKECFCCRKFITKGTKQVQCQFCTLAGCKECVYKQFPFPQIDESNPSAKRRGKICKLCETKFYIKWKMDDIFANIDQKELQQ